MDGLLQLNGKGLIPPLIIIGNYNITQLMKIKVKRKYNKFDATVA